MKRVLGEDTRGVRAPDEPSPSFYDQGWRTGSRIPCAGGCNASCPGCMNGETGLRSPKGEPWCLPCWHRFNKDEHCVRP